MTDKSRATGYRPNVGSTYKSSFDKEWDSNEEINKIVNEFCPTNGCDNCWSDSHTGCSDECKEEFKKAHQLKLKIEALLLFKDQEADRRVSEAIKKERKIQEDVARIVREWIANPSKVNKALEEMDSILKKLSSK